MKIGVVGWGEIGQFHAAQFAAAGAHLSAVVSSRQNLDLAVPVYSSLEDMLPHVDAVTIAVPNFLHADMCITAMEAGKPVLVEKPICINRRELRRIEAHSTLIRAPVLVGYRLRYNPDISGLKSNLGRPNKISCTYRMGFEELAADKNWTRSYAKTGGSFFTIGVHMLDLCRWLVDVGTGSLPILRASASSIIESVDYPLDVTLSCVTADGIELVARADLSEDVVPEIDIAVEYQSATGRSQVKLHQFPAEDEDIEYPLLISEFVTRAKTNEIDRDYLVSVLAAHCDLLKARDFALPDADRQLGTGR